MGRVACLALAIALTACASKPPLIFGERMPAGCTKETKSERCIGWLFDRVIMMAVFKPYEDDSIRGYVESIGQRLATARNDKRKWRFRVVDEDYANAYSGFNNTIYITRGSLGILRDEAELAAIIGHEMGHTIAGHNRESILDWGSDVGETQIEQWRQLRYARDDEIQADELAVVMLGRAGYDVHAVERMLRALGAGEEDEDASDDRHPIFRERIARAVALAGHYQEGERGVERYNERVAKLVVGADPRNGTILDNAIVFARAKTAIDLPEGAVSFQFGSWIFFGWEKTGVAGTVQILDRRVAKEVKKNKDPTVHTELKMTGNIAISITVVQDDKKLQDPVKIAKSLIATIRPPSKRELSRIHPMRFDPTVPRPLWSN